MRPKFLIGLITAITAITFIFAVRAGTEDIIDNSKDLFRQVQLFADSITLISTDYVEPVKAKDLVYGAIKGMMNTLDGYSQFLDPESFKEITEETKGEFGGLGMEIGMRDDVLTVIAPIEDTPAFAAGIQAGDKIVKIDDKITRDMTLDDAVKKMRGEPGSKVKITVIREGADEMLDFTITRAIIKLKSIKDAKVIEDGIGYVKLVEFQERTAKDLKANIKKLKGQGAKGLILDVRNNPGGLLDAAAEVADQFLKKGEMIVYTEGRDPKKRMEFRAKKEPDFIDMDLVVIVNKGSASAAEIVAGALKDNKRALVVGVPTFGKGSVQTVIPLQDKSALRLTTAAYFTPSGKNLMDKGIEPDIYVEREKPQEMPEEEAKKKKDEQKSRIFEKLKRKIFPERETAGEEPLSEKEEKEEAKELREYDEQVRTAVNILKGVQVFKDYGTVHPVEKENVQGG